MSTPDPNNAGQGMSSAFIEQIRQKLGLNLQTLLTVTKAAATYLTPAQAAAAYQPLSANIAKLVYGNGSLLSAPVIASGGTTISSNGTIGPYSVSFGVTFPNSVTGLAYAVRTTSAGFTSHSLSGAVSTTGFAVVIELLSGAAIGSGTSFDVTWTAVGF